jgi:hypothetical protein
MTTPLGRSVPQSDWKSLRADTILKLLYSVSRSPFNPNNDPVGMDVLMQATGLDPVKVHDIPTIEEKAPTRPARPIRPQIRRVRS